MSSKGDTKSRQVAFLSRREGNFDKQVYHVNLFPKCKG